MNELVSIVMPTFNVELYINDTIKSIISQTFQNWELLITDDCSKDKTWEMLVEFAKKDTRIKIFQLEQNSGTGIARNNSISYANGNYITFIDGDDFWESNFIERSINFCKTQNIDFVFSSYYRKNEDLSINFSDFIVPAKVSYFDVLKSCPISCLTAFINIKKLGKKYMPDLKKRQDAALWLAYLKETEFAYGIKEPLATYRMRKNSLSRNKLKVIKYQWQLYRKAERLPFFKSLYLILSWAYNGYLKYK